MKIISDIRKIKKYRKPVVALGVFDGLHLAHQRILKNTVKKAKEISGTSMVITFYPHPQREESLYSLEHRLRLINQLGIDVCIVIRFNKAFARISALNFVKSILIKKVRAKLIYVGKNFRFGKNARGDFRLLKKLSDLYNFHLQIFEVIKSGRQIISSSNIRRLIIQGKLARAEKLLGRPVSVFGTVIRGASLAKKLGFPTANINPHHEVLPPSGVYAIKAIFNKSKFSGICYIGTKPTIAKQKEYRLQKINQHIHIEVHLFNFKKNLYGKNLDIQFVKKIRSEKKFSSLNDLAKQIKKDIFAVQKYFSCH